MVKHKKKRKEKLERVKNINNTRKGVCENSVWMQICNIHLEK